MSISSQNYFEKSIEYSARKAGAKLILTTEKDGVKLKPNPLTLPFYKVALEMEILEGRETFNQHVLNWREVNYLN